MDSGPVGVDDGRRRVKNLFRRGLASGVLVVVVAVLCCWRERTRVVVVRTGGSVALRSRSWCRCLASRPLLIRQCARIRHRISRLLTTLSIHRRRTNTRRLPRRVSIDRFLQINAKSVSIPLNAKIRTLSHEIVTARTWRRKNVCRHSRVCICAKSKKSCQK